MVVWAPKVHVATLATQETSAQLAQLDAMVFRVTEPILAQLAILAQLVERDKQAKLDTLVMSE
jgi:hypothetical protein